MAGLLSAAVALAAILSAIYATLFHLWHRGEVRTLRIFLLAAWLGFAAGHFLSEILGVYLLRTGQLNVLGGTIGAIIALLFARAREA